MLHDILLVLLGLVVGAIIGFFVARFVMKKYLIKKKIQVQYYYLEIHYQF